MNVKEEARRQGMLEERINSANRRILRIEMLIIGGAAFFLAKFFDIMAVVAQ